LSSTVATKFVGGIIQGNNTDVMDVTFTNDAPIARSQGNFSSHFTCIQNFVLSFRYKIPDNAEDHFRINSLDKSHPEGVLFGWT
jgi:hypothetical protein